LFPPYGVIWKNNQHKGEYSMNSGYKLVLSVLLLGTLTGCGKSADEAVTADKGPTPVMLSGSAVMVAKVRSVYPKFELPAIVEAVQSARVKPEVSTTVTANHFTAGDMVEQGQLLVELDDARFQAELKSEEAELQSARAGVLQAESNWARAEDLMPKGYISALDYDKTKAAVETARAAVSRAEANLVSAQLRVQRTRIVAPFAGRISKPGHALGDQVGPLSLTPLFDLAQLDPIYVTASVELGMYNRFTMLRHQLESEGLEIPELKVTIDLIGAGEYPHPGVFEAWDHASGSSRGMIAARILFPNPEGLLLPGQTVTARGQAIKAIDRIFVPQKAVQQDQQGHFVLVIDSEDMVRRKNIEVGVRDGADWAVRSGLDAGDRVIIEGVQRLAPGMQATIGNSL
jgi:RND family efflux transporter MFP subunit